VSDPIPGFKRFYGKVAIWTFNDSSIRRNIKIHQDNQKNEVKSKIYVKEVTGFITQELEGIEDEKVRIKDGRLSITHPNNMSRGLEMPHDDKLNLRKGDSFSICCSFRTEVVGAWKRIITKRARCNYWWSVALCNSKIRLEVKSPENGLRNYTANKIVNDGKWHTFVCVRSIADLSLTLYVDGVMDVSFKEVPKCSLENDACLAIGKWANENYNGTNYTGDIMHLIFYKGTLSSDEVKTQYENMRIIREEDVNF